MMTIKKRHRFQRNLALVAAATLLTACSPPGASQLRQGEEYIQAGQFADAITVLRDATRILGNAPLPVQAKAWNLLGVACQGGGQLDAASKAYIEALRLDRNNVAIDYNLGCLRSQQTNFPGSIDYLNTYVSLRPRDVRGYLRLGTAHFHSALEQRSGAERNRLLEAARRDYDAAERLGGTADAANALGVLDLQRRPPSADAIRAAATNFGLALHRDAHFAPALLNLAIVSQQYLNNPRQAFRLYNDYLAITPLPPHANEVSNLVHELDLRLRTTITPQAAPAPVPAVTPRPPAPSAKVTAPPSGPVAAVPRPAPVELPPAQVSVVAPVSKPAPAAAPAPPPQPPPRTFVPPPRAVVPPPAIQASAAPSYAVNTPNPVPEPVVTEAAPPPRKTFTQRVNPLRWLEGKPRPSEGASAAELPAVPAGTRYAYLPPITPLPGDRAQAKRLLAEAIRARQPGDLTQTIRDYKEAIQADATFYDARYGLGLAAIEARDYDTALESLQRALALRDDSAEARYAFAWLLQKRGYTEDAVRELSKLLAQHPDEVRARLMLGSLYAEKLGQPKLAREQYMQALALDPNNAQATNLRAWLQQNP